MKYSGFDGLLCFSVEMIAKFIILHIKTPCPVHWGHYFLYISDERSDKIVNNKTNLFDSPDTPPSVCAMLSLKKQKYTFSSHPKKSVLSWPNLICGGRTYANKLKGGNLVLSSMATVSLFQSVVRIDPALKSIFVRRTSYRENYYSFQRSPRTLGQNRLPRVTRT